MDGRVRFRIMRMRILISVLVGLVVMAGCSGDENDTTTLPEDASATAPSVAAGGGGTNDGANDGGTSETTVVDEIPSTTTTEVMAIAPYEVIHRSPGDNGDTLVIALEDISDGITDHDLEQLILDVVDTYGPVAEAHVVDDASVLELVLSDPADLTDDQKTDLDAHYLLRLMDGTTVSFQGAFQDVPGYEIGS